MKKLFVLALVALGASQGLRAQNDIEFGYFDHLSVGVSVGTDGIGFDLAAPISDYAAVRGGFSFMPTIKVDKTIHLKRDVNTYYQDIKIQGKSKIFDGKLLLDFYPFKTSSFHLTAGAFFGGEEFANIVNKSPILKNPADYGTLGLIVGTAPNPEYEIITDLKGNAKIKLKSNGFKPYLGLGFGRAVQKNSRLGFSFDAGVKFWGEPGVYAKARDFNNPLAQWEENHRFRYEDLGSKDDKDLKDAFETIEKIKVYPILNLRLTYRIF